MLTLQAKGCTSQTTRDGRVVVVLLLSQVRGSAVGEDVDTTGCGCRGKVSDRSEGGRAGKSVEKRYPRTKSSYHAATVSKHAPGANIRLRQRVLDGSHEETCSTAHEGALDAIGDGILGFVMVIVAVRRHFGGCWEKRGRGKSELGRALWCAVEMPSSEEELCASLGIGRF
jgi:hypothetical protein